MTPKEAQDQADAAALKHNEAYEKQRAAEGVEITLPRSGETPVVAPAYGKKKAGK